MPRTVRAETACADIYFAPTAEVVYPPTFTATVSLAGPIVETFEGAHRGSGHFHGVTTVVTKLLMMIRPDRAYFGQKDAQQLRVVQAPGPGFGTTFDQVTMDSGGSPQD